MPGIIRRATDINEVEHNPFSHKYLLKRPRTHESTDISRSSSGFQTVEDENQQIDNPAREKRRFELFIDLIWVGIVGNLAEHFSDQAYRPESEFTLGRAVFEFVILFLIAWRMWKYLQEFMGKYRTDDLVERAFVVWTLVLAMLYGNNAIYMLDDSEKSFIAITIYLVFKFSVLVIESYYSMHIPHIRRRTLLQTALGLPLVGVWMGAIYTEYPRRAVLAFVAVALEYWVAAVIETPLAERFLRDNRKEILDSGHWVERVGDFYIIILGEGVLNLIRGSPLGRGLSLRGTAGVFALWAYYVLSGLYFNGDLSHKYIHAVRRAWWRRILWLSFHVSIFGATLIFGVSANVLIENPFATSLKPPEEALEEEHRLAFIVNSARWTVSSTLALVLIGQSVIALMNKSLDGPGSLKISNRYIRLLPRVMVVIIALCLPIAGGLKAVTYLGIVVATLILCLLWEWCASLEKGGGFIEP